MQVKIIFAVVLIGIGWVYTLITYGQPKDWKRRAGIICPLVRMAAFLILAGFIINPGFPWIRRVVLDKPGYIVDASGSMSITDTSDQSRFQRAVELFPGKSIIAAAESTHLFNPTADPDLTAFSPRTNLGTMIQQAILLSPETHRLIIASDGIHNTGIDPVQTARLLSREISCVLIDDSGEPGDVRIDRISVPSLVLPEQGFTVNTVLAYSGPDSTLKTTAHLALNGREVSTRQVVLSPDSTLSVSFPVSFDTPGSSRVAISVDSLPGERVTENNRALRTITVRQRYRTCRMTATRPVHDGALLYQALTSDGGFHISRTIRPLNLSPVPGDSVTEILILGLYDDTVSNDLYPRSTAVLRRGGVLVLLGWPQESPWSSISPLWCSNFSARDGHVVASPGMNRSLSLLFGLHGEKESPPQRIPAGKIGVSPRAEIAGETDGTPIIAVQPWQGGYVLTWLGSDWWRRMFRREETGSIDWPGIIRWLLTPEGRGRLRIHTGRQPLESGMPLVIRLEAFSRGWEPTVRGEAVVCIQTLSGSVHTHKRIRFHEAGPVAVDFPPVPAGSWILSAEALLEDGDSLTAEKRIRIRDTSREFLRTVPDASILKRLASETGGVFMRMDDSASIDSFMSQGFEGYETEYIRFRAFWPAFLLFVVLLTVEWWLRHQQGLP